MADPIPNEGLRRQQELTQMLDTIRKGQIDVIANGNPIQIGQKLGSGGSKTVYDAVLGGDHFALALPNIVDGVEVMERKWQSVLQEPDSTSRVRDLGIRVNTRCELLPVTVNGVPFQALLMHRYEDLPFKVLDGKNPTFSRGLQTQVEKFDSETFQQIFDPVLSDLAVMIKGGVRVGKDSINLCWQDNALRVFLSDLGSAQFEDITASDFGRYSKYYSMFALDAFINTLPEQVYQQNKYFFDNRELYGEIDMKVRSKIES